MTKYMKDLSGVQLAVKKSPFPSDASLDRINSNFGYVEGNIQWINKKLNRAKLEITNDYFISMCSAVHHYRGKK